MTSFFVKTVLAGGVGLVGGNCYWYFSGSPWYFQRVVMPAARMLEPETADRVAIQLASKGIVPKDKGKDFDILVCGPLARIPAS
jgi:hypothetical protein